MSIAGTNARLPALPTRTPTLMNRIVLLIIATLTGLGAAYSVWLNLGTEDGTTTGTLIRAIVAIVVIGAMLITWEALFKAPAARVTRLKRTALLILVTGILGVGINAFLSSRTNDPDGPVFVLSLLLVLQAFLTIAHASRSE